MRLSSSEQSKEDDTFLSALDELSSRVERSGLVTIQPARSTAEQPDLITSSMALEQIEQMVLEGEHRLKHLEQSISLLRKLRERRIEELASRERAFEGSIWTSLGQHKAKKLIFERKLRTQMETVTSRLQDLAFECVGEVEKTMRRLESYTAFGQVDSELRRTSTTGGLRWNILLERLAEDSLGRVQANGDQIKESAWRLEEEILDCLAESKRSKAQEGGMTVEREGEVVKVKRVATITYNDKGKVLLCDSSKVKTSRQSNGKPKKKQTIVAEFESENHSLLTQLYSDAGIKCFSHQSPFQDVDSDPDRHKNGLREGQATDKELVFANFQRRVVKGTKKYPLFHKDSYLSCQVLTWLLWPEFGRSPTTRHVYYCLEERAGFGVNRDPCLKSFSEVYASTSETRDLTLKTLETLHEKKADQPQGLPVHKLEGRHREHYLLDRLEDTRAKSRMKNFPDVVVSPLGVHSGEACHFVPATVQNLLETVRFMDLNSRQLTAHDRAVLREHYGAGVEHNSLGTLYIVMPQVPAEVCALSGLREEGPHQIAQPSGLEPLQVVPLPNEALDELIGCFLVRSCCLDNSTRSLMKPDLRYAVSLGPAYSGSSKPLSSSSSSSKTRQVSTSFSKVDGLEGGGQEDSIAGILVNFCIESQRGEQKETETPLVSDVPVMTNLCFWRGCNAFQAAEDAHGLCEYHSYFRELLEREDVQEVKRHLPKQSLDTLKQKTDLQSILKASSLVMELLNKKLVSTVQGFCARAANAARPKRSAKRLTCEEREENATRRKTNLDIEIELARKVAVAERHVVQELSRFAELGVFPSDELVAIRHEYRILNEEREALVDGDSDSALFRSQALYLEREYGRLVASYSENPESDVFSSASNKSNNNNSNGRRNRSMSAVSSEDGQDGGSGTELRARHLIEAELELDFCLRKLSILREKRASLEAAAAAAAIAQEQSDHQQSNASLERSSSSTASLQRCSKSSKQVPSVIPFSSQHHKSHAGANVANSSSINGSRKRSSKPKRFTKK